MRYLLVLFICIVVVGCGGSTHRSQESVAVDLAPEPAHSKEEEMIEMLVLVTQYCPESLEAEDPVKVFRNHIHWCNHVKAQTLSLPFEAEVYEETVTGKRGNLCGGMSIHLAAFLQIQEYTFRHVELWTGDYLERDDDEPVPITHSVIEVKTVEGWVLHDTTYNCIFLVEGKPASAEDIQEALGLGLEIIPDLQGCPVKPEYSINAEGFLETYLEYFNDIKYTYTEVIF